MRDRVLRDGGRLPPLVRDRGETRQGRAQHARARLAAPQCRAAIHDERADGGPDRGMLPGASHLEAWDVVPVTTQAE